MFVQTIRRNALTEETMGQLGLSDRQRKAVVRVMEQGLLTNTDYQELTGASRTTARRDLEELISKGVLVRQGEKRGVHYVLAPKWLINGSNGS
jgi:ATP-dependent DNA helicase RecG